MSSTTPAESITNVLASLPTTDAAIAADDLKPLVQLSALANERVEGQADTVTAWENWLETIGDCCRIGNQLLTNDRFNF